MTLQTSQRWAMALANCDREPVHTPAGIQSFGALITTDRSLSTITHISTNLGQVLGQPQTSKTQAWLGQPLSVVLPDELIHDLGNACSLSTITMQRYRLGEYPIHNQSVEVAVHCTQTRTLIELEPSRASENNSRSPLVMRAKAMLEEASSSDELLRLAVRELRNTTGFDRVMAYRFLDDGAGEVVAEARSKMIESFLGLRYPASDIPKPVRALFLKAPIRVIADNQTEAISLIAWDMDEPPLDLSLALLRGLSPIHQTYLTNMHVNATMSIAIIINGNLWGLFALHHRQRKLVSPDLRSLLELFGQLFSLQFQQKLAEESFRDRKRTASTLHNIFADPIPDSTDTTDAITQPSSCHNWKRTIIEAHRPLCGLLSADGVAYVCEQTVLAQQGDVPPQSAIVALVEHYSQQASVPCVTTENISALNISSISNWGKSAGALWISIPTEPAFFLIFFRNEIIHQIRWGGDPNGKKIEEEAMADGSVLRLHPRESFAEYQELVQNQAHPWGKECLNTALEIQTELSTFAQAKHQDFQARQQNLLIAELNHRVKNILTLIRSVARQTENSSQSLVEYVTMLEKRIAALSAAHDLVTGYGLEWPSVQKLLEIELRPYMHGQRKVTFHGPNVGLKANFVPTFVLVIHELTSNAAKYGALSTATGQVTIDWNERNGGIHLTWQESDGPIVQPPTRRGFGRDLIERAIPYEFEGEAIVAFNPDGVQAEFWLPHPLIRWSSVSNNEEQTTHVVNEEPLPPSTAPTQILVVEDSLLVAMEMETILTKLGFACVTSAPNVKQAFRCLEKEHYDICLLDINLKQETSFDIARFLLKKNIPFAFTSGYNSKYTIPDSLKSVILLKKPVDAIQLESVLHDLQSH